MATGYEWIPSRCSVQHFMRHENGRPVGIMDAPWVSVCACEDGTAYITRKLPVVDGYSSRLDLVNEYPEYYPERWFGSFSAAKTAAERWIRGEKRWNRGELTRRNDGQRH